jgi:hypothetical protein
VVCHREDIRTGWSEIACSRVMAARITLAESPRFEPRATIASVTFKSWPITGGAQAAKSEESIRRIQ